VSLNLSHNQLSGSIPSSLSKLPVLGELDLSVNQLSGKIPKNLGEIESLVEVNISHNHFHGYLPSTGAFLAISSSAVAGNNLCSGDTTTTGLPPCKHAKTPVWWFFVAFLFAVLVILVIATFVIVFARQRKNHEIKRVENEDGSVWELQLFDSKISKETTMDDFLSSIRDENKSIQLKEMNSMPTRFWTELSKLQHPNIAKIVAMVRSEKVGFLVYEYIEGKSLSEVIGGLNWERRRKIAIGIARALCYLHCFCSPTVLVGDLLPEKIVIDGEDEPRLRLCIPGIMCTDTKCFFSSAYVAPGTLQEKYDKIMLIIHIFWSFYDFVLHSFNLFGFNYDFVTI